MQQINKKTQCCDTVKVRFVHMQQEENVSPCDGPQAVMDMNNLNVNSEDASFDFWHI